MMHFILLLALSGFSMASLTGFSGRKGGQQSDFAGIDNKPLSLSVSCSSFETECDGYCIPSTGECCSYGDGSYCGTGDYCTSGGCCENGEICTGEATGCDDGKELCGDYCIPEGSVCCTDGSYCDSGETCTGDGFCTGSDSSSDNATEIVAPQPTGTYTNGNDDSDDDDNDDDDQGHTLCARKIRGGSSDSTDDDDDDDSDCGNDGAGSILTPNLAGTLWAVVILLL